MTMHFATTISRLFLAAIACSAVGCAAASDAATDEQSTETSEALVAWPHTYHCSDYLNPSGGYDVLTTLTVSTAGPSSVRFCTNNDDGAQYVEYCSSWSRIADNGTTSTYRGPNGGNLYVPDGLYRGTPSIVTAISHFSFNPNYVLYKGTCQ